MKIFINEWLNIDLKRSVGISPDLQFLSNYQQSFRSIGLSVSYLFHAKAIKPGAGNNRGIKGRETKKINQN